MFDFHEKRKIRSTLYSRPVIGFLLAVTVLLSISAYNRYTVAEEMEAKLRVKEHELDDMKQRAAAIEAKVEYLKDERGIEEELRNRFDAIRDGEQAVIFINSEGERATVSPKDEEENGEFEAHKPSFIERLRFW